MEKQLQVWAHITEQPENGSKINFKERVKFVECDARWKSMLFRLILPFVCQ